MINLDQDEVETARPKPENAHPLGRTVAFDHDTGLPIIRRDTGTGNTRAPQLFDPKVWQKANPKGNVKAAITRAKKLGYKVVG